MTQPRTRCLFAEGSVTLPEGYRDKTINLFVAAQPDAASISISRDILQPGQTAENYISEQLAMLAQQMKNWQQQSRQPVAAGKHLPAGENICASYSSGDSQRIWQSQSVFALENGKILVFTLSRSAPLQPADQQLLSDLLDGFTPAQAQ